jgi:hypothetical protein
MAPLTDPRRPGRGAPFQPDTSSATLFALLLAVAMPALVVALAAGWRPLDADQSASLGQWVARLTGRGAAASTSPAPAADWAVANGWFFTQVHGQPGAPPSHGYAVTDSDGMTFWSEYQRLGGPTVLGYPLSRRFTADGATMQVFQRGVLRYDAAAERVRPLRLLDRLHEEGRDTALAAQWGVPLLETPAPAEAPPEAVEDRLAALFADYPAFPAYLRSVPDPAATYGLPTSAVHDVGAFYVVRFQGGALQEWKQEVPWARAGDVTAANIGEIAVALGVFPDQALTPVPAAGASGVAVR